MSRKPKTPTTPSTPTPTSRDDLQQLCKGLRLTRLAEILDRELESAEKSGLSHSALLVRLLREEYHAQQARFLQHRIGRARLPERWTLETFPWDRQTGVRKAQILQLAELDFVARAANLVFIGPTGVGKTGLASGLLMRALAAGHGGLFIKAQQLFDDMYTSLADHSTRTLLDRLTRIELLVVDELGYLNLRPEQSNIFFKLMEERYQRKATILTTNLDYEEWYAFLGQKKMVEALLDRMRHHCHTIRIDGPSLRAPQG